MERDGSLVAKGSKADLWEMEATVLLERQTEIKGEVTLIIETPTMLDEGDDVGITAYYDEHSYLKYGLATRKGTLGLLLSEYLADHYQSERFLPFPAGKTVTLSMEIDGLDRRFSCSGAADIVLTDTRYLASEGLSCGKRFTGAMLGLYVHGPLVVRFLSWSYRPTEAV